MVLLLPAAALASTTHFTPFAPRLASSSNISSPRRLNWYPCVEAGRCGTTVTIQPDHELLRYQGYVLMDRSPLKARFDRTPFGEGSVLQLMSPATRITFRTTAHRVIVVLEYRGKRACSADCPLVASGGCYEPKPCPNECEVQVDVDGVPATGQFWTNLVDLPLTGGDSRLDFLGEVKLHAFEQKEPTPRTITLHLPWGAPVDLKRILLETLPDVPVAPEVLELPAPPTVKLVALGDSITAGWCLPGGNAFPRQLAEMHGWDHINLGVAGAGVGAEAHGTAAGKLRGDLLTIMSGINEWQACNRELNEPMSKLIAAIRAEQPAVPIVVVTPTVSWREGLPCPGPAAVTPEQQREQIGAAVRARQQSDPNLFLVSGLQIMPKEYVGDGLHPTDLGQRELALNLNAQMGFSPLQFEVKSCPPLSVAVSGLTPSQWFDFYWGVRAEAPTFVGGDDWQGCKGRSLMLSPYGKVAGVADERGEALVTVEAVDKFDSCHEAVFEVLEASRCVNSRLGHVSTAFNGKVGTAAEKWALPVSAPPPPVLVSPPPPPVPKPAPQAQAQPKPAAQEPKPKLKPQPEQPQHPPHEHQPPAEAESEGEGEGKGKGPPCSSHHKGDTHTESCAAWCKDASHCEWCKCRACDRCTSSAAAAVSVAEGGESISGGDEAVSEAPDDLAAGLDEEAARRQHLLMLAVAGAATGLLVLCAIGLACACCRCLGRLLRRRGKRYDRALSREEDAALLPAHFEVAGKTQVVAVQLDPVRSLKELRELLVDSYLEVFDVELLGAKMIIEYEDPADGFVRLEDSSPIKAGKLLTALSVHVTARRMRDER